MQRLMFFTPENMHNAKKSHILMLYKMARADDRNHLNEDKMIRELADRMGLTADDLFEIQHHPERFEFTLPKTEDERLIVLYHLLFLMRIDGEITVEEQEMLRALGFRLGLSPAMINDLIRLMLQHIDKPLPDGVMLETIRKYQN